MGKITKRLVSISVLLIFSINACCYGLTIYPAPNDDKLAAQPAFQLQMMNAGGARFQNRVFSDIELATAILNIAEYLLGNPKDNTLPLPLKYLKSVMNNELGKKIDVIDVSKTDMRGDVVIIPYTKDGYRYDIQIALAQSLSAQGLPGEELFVSDVYIAKRVPAGYRDLEGWLNKVKTGKTTDTTFSSLEMARILKWLYNNIEIIQEQEIETILSAMRIYLAELKDTLESKNIDLEKHITIEEVLEGIRKDRGKQSKKTKFVKKIKGELSDIVSKKNKPVAITEAGISHMFGLGYRTANGFIFSPSGKAILQRRVHNKAEAKKLSIFGGHVVAGQPYEESMRREILEELSLDEIEDDLQNDLSLIGCEGQFMNNDPKNTEFRSLYAYVLTEEEYEHVLRKKEDIDDKRAELTVSDFEKWIEKEQKAKSGYGEVWGYHIVDFQDLISRQNVKIEETFKGRKRVIEEVDYTSDLLLPLVVGEAPLRPGTSKINPMEEVKRSLERQIQGTPYYALYLHETDLSKVLKLPYAKLRRLYGFKDVSFVRILFGGGSSKIDESPVLISADNSRYVLRHLYDEEMAKYIISYQMKLEEKGIPAPTLIPTKNGSFYFEHRSKIYYLEKHLHIGQEVDRKDLSEKHYAGMGRMAARLHNAVENKPNLKGTNIRKLREEIGELSDEFSKRHDEVAGKAQSEWTEVERIFMQNYDFFMEQIALFKKRYKQYLAQNVPDIAIHGDFAYTNIRFNKDGDVVGVFDTSRAHNTKPIVELNQVVFGRKGIGAIYFNKDYFLSALEAYQKEANNKLGVNDIRGLFEVFRSRFIEDLRNSLVNKVHRYYISPDIDIYHQRLKDVKSVIDNFRYFIKYADDLREELLSIQQDVERGSNEQKLIEEKIFTPNILPQSLPLLVSVYQSLDRRTKGIILKEFADLIYYNPDSDIATLCVAKLAQDMGIMWAGVMIRKGNINVITPIAALRETMLNPLITNKRLYKRLSEHYGIAATDPEQIAINKLIRRQGVFQDLLLYKSRRPRIVSIMKSITNNPSRVKDILEGKFSPLTGEIHPGVSCGKIRCRFCYNARFADDGSGTMLAPIGYVGKENALNWGEIKALIDDYIQSGVKEIYVCGGKEPWYSGHFKDSDKKTVDLIRYMRQKSESVIISMLTIGLALNDEDVRKVVVECMNIVRVSLDAASPEKYDDIKGLSYLVHGSATSGTFEEVKEGIRKTLKLRNRNREKSKLKIGMSFTCTEENYAELEKFLAIAQEWGVDFFDIKGVLADPKSEEKIRKSMDYIAALYDRAVMGEFGNLNVYFHENFFKKIGKRFNFDEDLKKTAENTPDKCYLARSGMRTTVVIPNGRTFVCVNSSQPGYDSTKGEEWDKYRMGLYKGKATIRDLVEEHEEISSKINRRNCEHGTSTDENINSIMWKLDQDNDDGFSLENQPISPEPDNLYYDGRAMYHKELADGYTRGDSEEGVLLPASSIMLTVPDISESTLDVTEYVGSKLPSEMLNGLRGNRVTGLELHLGTANDTTKILEKFRSNDADVKELVLQSPYNPTGERYYQVIDKDGSVHFVISAVRGRLSRFLAILKNLNIDLEKVKIRDFNTDWISVYKNEISSNIKGMISKAVICQNPVELAKRMKKYDSNISYEQFSTEHIRYVLIHVGATQLILLNLADAYGSHISKMLQYITLPRNIGGLEAKDVLFIGECGGVGSSIGIGDLLLPSCTYEGGEVVGDIDNGVLGERISQLRTKDTGWNILSGAVETIPAILLEDKKQLETQKGQGIQGVELELAHMIKVIKGIIGIKFNAVLEVTDLPGKQKQRLGELGPSAEPAKREMNDVMAKMIINTMESEDIQHLASKTKSSTTEIAESQEAIEVDYILAAIITLARKAKREKQKLIIGLETDWIPGYENGKLQHNALSSLIREIESLGDTLRSLGLDNVVVVHSKSESLAGDLLREADKTSTKLSNVVVIASNSTINSEAFASLRNAEGGERAFLAGIDPTELIKFYAENKETIDKQLTIRIMEMLSITLELALGKEAPNLPIIATYDKVLRMVIFLPKPEPVDYRELLKLYRLKKLALHSA